MIEEVKRLLDFFDDHVPDKETNRLVWAYYNDHARWQDAKSLFEQIRRKALSTHERDSAVKQCQYAFEEACCKSLYNLVNPTAPFDADTPFWVTKNALILSDRLGIPDDKITSIILPTRQRS